MIRRLVTALALLLASVPGIGAPAHAEPLARQLFGAQASPSHQRNNFV